MRGPRKKCEECGLNGEAQVRWAGSVGGIRRLVGAAQLRERLSPPILAPHPVATGYRLATTYIHPAQAMPVS